MGLQESPREIRGVALASQLIVTFLFGLSESYGLLSFSIHPLKRMGKKKLDQAQKSNNKKKMTARIERKIL